MSSSIRKLTKPIILKRKLSTSCDSFERSDEEERLATGVCTRSLTPKFLQKIGFLKSSQSQGYMENNKERSVENKSKFTFSIRRVSSLRNSFSNQEVDSATTTPGRFKAIFRKVKTGNKDSLVSEPFVAVSKDEVPAQEKAKPYPVSPYQQTSVTLETLTNLPVQAPELRLSYFLNSKNNVPNSKIDVSDFKSFMSKYRPESPKRPILKNKFFGFNNQTTTQRRTGLDRHPVKAVRFSKKLLLCVFKKEEEMM